jgi:pimeloyl-ACP methyl ester carboxylesterase
MAAPAVRVFEHGTMGPCVIVVHGGPGAPGDATPLAAELGLSFRVLEPWQRGSGDEPLTVARHVEDLHEVVLGCGAERPAIVGHSWGAMLALAYAAAHPCSAGPLVLVGCGTYDLASRAVLGKRRRERGTGDYALDEAVCRPEVEFDFRAHQETWDDELRLQAEGVHPGSFSAIRSDVLMVHGDVDPHPGLMVRDSLRPYVPQLEYRELARCGHYPWLERHARETFFRVVREWLLVR